MVKLIISNLQIAEDDASASHLLQQEEMRGKIKTAMDYAEKEAGEAASRATKDLKVRIGFLWANIMLKTEREFKN